MGLNPCQSRPKLQEKGINNANELENSIMKDLFNKKNFYKVNHYLKENKI